MKSKNEYLNDIKNSEFNLAHEVVPLANFKTDITFDRLYKEIYQFNIDNNHLQLPKLMLYFRKNIKDIKKIQTTCSVLECKETDTRMTICTKHRRRIADELATIATKDKFLNPRFIFIFRRLMLDEKMVIKNSQEYPQSSTNYFSNVFSFLAYQKEMIHELLLNISYKSVNFELFDFLFVIHSFLDDICRLLILLYSCFDWSFIYMFYPWFEQALGSNVCNEIFCTKKQYVQDVFAGEGIKDIPAVIALRTATDNRHGWKEEYLQEIKESMLGIRTFIQLVGDLYQVAGNNINDDGNSNSTHPLRWVFAIESKLNEIIGNIHFQNTIIQMEKMDIELDKIQDYKISLIDDQMKIGKFRLIDLNISKNILEQTFKNLKSNATQTYPNLKHDGCIYYDYHSFKDLRAALSCSWIIPEIIDIICDYIGIVDWSPIDKSDKISLVQSNDGNISYAVVDNTQDGQDTILFNQSIFLQEYFGDSGNNNCGGCICRYVFKAIEYRDHLHYQDDNENDGVAHIRVGFATSKFNVEYSTRLESDMIGTYGNHSMSWYSSGDECRFDYLNKRSLINWNCYDIGYRKAFDTTNENTYFMIEVNLISNVMAVYTEAISNNCQVRDISNDIIQF